MFHLYGLIIGFAIMVGVWLAQKKAQIWQLNLHEIDQAFWWIIIGGILGARIYHVLTDFNFYYQDWTLIPQIWLGGLSIIGALIGGFSATFFYAVFILKKPLQFWQILDLAAFVLPVAQAIGRLGNWVNQELYGLPTNLPWGIFIQPQHRLLGWEQFSHYHPLFLYEALALAIFSLIIWNSDRFKHHRQPGFYFWSFLMYYSMVRLGLDFLRLDKNVVGWGLAQNQWLIIGFWLSIIVSKLVTCRKKI